MLLDQLILKRFEELEEQAAQIVGARGRMGGGRPASSPVVHGWAVSTLGLLRQVFGESSDHYKRFSEHLNAYSRLNHDSRVDNCRAILSAARDDYENGYLFSVRAHLKAEASMDALEQATELLSAKQKDLACVAAGIALEVAIRELCQRESIPHAKLDVMNAALCKKGIYNMGMQKQITAWAHWRNKAAHGEWGEYNQDDVKAMIEGIQRFVADYLR